MILLMNLVYAFNVFKKLLFYNLLIILWGFGFDVLRINQKLKKNDEISKNIIDYILNYVLKDMNSSKKI